MKSKTYIDIESKKGLSEISKRFLKVLEAKNYTGYKFAKEIPEVTESKITFIRNGRNNPSTEMLQFLISKFPDISNAWLLTGEGEMFNDGTKTKVISLEPQLEPTGFYYPNVSAAAGMDKEMVNDELLRIPISIPNWGKDLDFINVFGDSMYPKFCSGEIIGIKEIQPEYVIFGHAYVIILNDGEVYLKYIKKSEKVDHWTLASENNKYDANYFHLSLIKKIFIVKGVLTKTTM